MNDELRQHAAAETDRRQRQHPAQRTFQDNEAKGQEEQQMVRTQQRVAQATQQSLPGSQRIGVAHAEGMVGESRAGDQQQPQETDGGLAQRPGGSQKIGQGRSSSVVLLAGVLADAGRA